jgi:tetratricopeptide (TPR) repeat protein
MKNKMTEENQKGKLEEKLKMIVASSRKTLALANHIFDRAINNTRSCENESKIEDLVKESFESLDSGNLMEHSRLLNQAFELNAVETYAEIGEIYRIRKDFDKAKIAFEKILDISQTDYSKVISKTLLANFHVQQRNLDDAIRLYKEAAEIDPKPVFNFCIARIYEKKEKWDDAINEYQKVLSSEKSDGSDLFNANMSLAMIYNEQLKDRDLAIEHFVESCRKAYKDFDYRADPLMRAWTPESLSHISLILDIEKKYEDMIAVNKYFTEEYLDNMEGYYNLAHAYDKLKRLDEADEYIIKGIEIGLKDIKNKENYSKERYRNLGSICMYGNKFEYARKIFQDIMDSPDVEEEFKESIKIDLLQLEMMESKQP